MPLEILIAEDSPTQAEKLRTLLDHSGYRVMVARSGEEALERLEEDRPDILLSDIVMPGISGYELCRRAKESVPDLPVILLTSLADPMDIVRGLEAGADNYITKPYDPEHLLARLRRVADSRRLRSGARTSLGVNITFLGNTFTISSEKEQILDLLLSSVEDTVRVNRKLEERQRELSEAHAKLEMYATEQARDARRSAERYRTLMQNADDAIFVLDEGGMVVEANARAADLLGVPLEEAPFHRLSDLLLPDAAAAVLEGIARSDHGRRATTDLHLPRPGGEAVWIEISTSTIQLEDETLTLAIAHDVTERRLAEERLRGTLADLKASEEMLRTVFKASPIAILIVDTDLRVREWNDAAESVFGWKREEVVGKPIPFLTEEELHREAQPLMHRIADGETVTGVEVRRRRRDGRPADLSLSIAPLYDEGGAVGSAVAIVMDITERNRREEELRQGQRLEAIGRLTGGVAHDFNNVLATIQGGTQLLLMDTPMDSPAREELEEIDKAAGRATALTRQLLAFSRKQVLQPRVLDPNHLVEEMSGMVRRLIGEDIALRLELDPRIGHIRADAAQMQQVVMNLVVNARDAMAKGGTITIRTRAVAPEEPFQDKPTGACVLLTVEDTGEGMAPEVRERIFEPFFTTKGEAEGTGLGLSTVYGIVRQSGGLVEVESEPGAGSTFRILFPCVEEELDQEPPPAVESSPEGSETILLVEDDRAVRTVSSRILRRYGYTVLEAPSGPDALDMLEGHDGPVHLLVTDLMMPGMSGNELAAELRRRRPNVPVLYMSGYSEDSVLHASGEPSAFPLLEKPFTPDVLARRVREVLDRKG